MEKKREKLLKKPINKGILDYFFKPKVINSTNPLDRRDKSKNEEKISKEVPIELEKSDEDPTPTPKLKFQPSKSLPLLPMQHFPKDLPKSEKKDNDDSSYDFTNLTLKEQNIQTKINTRFGVGTFSILRMKEKRKRARCCKCGKIWNNVKRLQMLGKHVKQGQCCVKKPRTKPQAQPPIQRQSFQSNAKAFIKNMLRDWQEHGLIEDVIHSELDEAWKANCDPRDKGIAKCAKKLANILKDLTVLSFGHSELMERPKELYFENARISYILVDRPYHQDNDLFRSLEIFHQARGSLQTKKSVIDQMTVVEKFLDYCHENQKKVNKDTIQYYLVRFKKFTDNTIRTYLNTLNALLPIGIPRASFKRKTNLRTQFNKRAKRIPIQVQIKMFEILKKKDPELYQSAFLLKYSGARANELIYLQKKNLIKIVNVFEKGRTTYWLRYLQSKTDADKAVQIPKFVYDFYGDLKDNDYLVHHKTSKAYRAAYRKALIGSNFKYYTPHCWRHTGATEIMIRCRNNGTSAEDGRMQARWFLGHLKSGRNEHGNLSSYDEQLFSLPPILKELDSIQKHDPEYASTILTIEQLEIVIKSQTSQFIAHQDPTVFNEIHYETLDLEYISNELWQSKGNTQRSEESSTQGFMPFILEDKATMEYEKEMEIVEKNRMLLQDKQNKLIRLRLEMQEKENVIQNIIDEKKGENEENREIIMEVEEEKIGNNSNIEKATLDLEEVEVEKVPPMEIELKNESKEIMIKDQMYRDLIGSNLSTNKIDPSFFKEGEDWILDEKSKLHVPRNMSHDDGFIFLPFEDSRWGMVESSCVRKTRMKWTKFMRDRNEKDLTKKINEHGQNMFLNPEKCVGAIDAKDYLCLICHKSLSKTEDPNNKMMQCHICNDVCHVNCEETPEGRGKIIWLNKKKICLWFCQRCGERCSNRNYEIDMGSFDRFPYQGIGAKCEKKHAKRGRKYICHPTMIEAKNLDTALTQNNIRFDDHLVYSGNCTRSENNCKNSRGTIYGLSDANLETYRKFRSFTNKKCYPNLELKYFKNIGWSVLAREDIKKNTFICVYSGNVFH